MSCDWDIFCKTCNQACGLEIHRDPGWIKRMIPMLPLISTLEPLEDIISEQFYEQRMLPGNLLEFAKKHHSHELLALNEYGEFDGDCNEQFRCSCCSTTLKCTLPEGHTGDHKKERSQAT